jgi:hypothetical protein
MTSRVGTDGIYFCSFALPTIFDFLSTRDLLQSQLVCKEWRDILSLSSGAAT